MEKYKILFTVSQIFNLNVESFIVIILVLKSEPIVGSIFVWNTLSTNEETILDFPTPNLKNLIFFLFF